MDTYSFRSSMPSVTDVYTDLSGLQNLKNEENNEAALKKVAQQFESMFISMLMKNMRAANDVFSEGNMFDTQEVKFYRDMHDNQLSLTLAHGQGFGIADAMYRQLSAGKGLSESKGIVDLSRTSITALTEMSEGRAIDVLPNQVNSILSKALNADVASEQDKQAADAVNFATKAQASSDEQLSDNRYSLAASPQEFVEKVLPSARIAADKLDVDAEVLVAQSALETGWGAKIFADQNGAPTFNLFNIKASSQWQGDTVYKNSLEFLGGQFANVASKFRSYSSVEESFQDFSNFILSSERYQGAVQTAADGLDFIKKIHSAGYATDPQYVEKIASVYERVKSMIADSAKHTERDNEL
jgi:flagellar protein FlgJ